MTEHAFTLLPFPGPGIPNITVGGKVLREQNQLTVQYSLTGDLREIFFPEPLAVRGRRDGLWRTTCFEFFLAIFDQPQYWEFNLSPSGEWNAFRMDAYRTIGFQQEEMIQDMQLEISREEDRFHLKTCVDLGAILESGKKIQVGITSVIQSLTGQETYWALTHPGPHADFHLRESFILTL